jgi:hypothetical protein
MFYTSEPKQYKIGILYTLQENFEMDASDNKYSENFRSVVQDFTKDLTLTFPEYSYLWNKWSQPETPEHEWKFLYDYCIQVYPARFFDILYQTKEIFDAENETNTHFLPNVDFKLLFHCENVSESTKKSIWKYLQLILFTIVGSMKDKTSFGDSMSLFDGIDEKDLQEKLNDTMHGLSDFFKSMEKGTETETETETETDGKPSPFRNLFENMNFGNGDVPTGDFLHNHLKSLFDGKIGSLAKELAEEISDDFKDLLGEEAGDMKNTSDVFKKLMKDPKKIMSLMKKVSNKLDDKMKNGDISREDIMKEAGDMFHRMKEMSGGNNDMAEMLKNMAKTMGMGKNVRVDTNAMDRMTKMASTRDRMRANIEKKKQKQLEEIEKLKQRKQAEAAKYSLSENSENSFVFRLDNEEKQEKSMKSHADQIADLLIAEEENAAQGKVTVSKKKSKKTKK